jgi:hypothetical protein
VESTVIFREGTVDGYGRIALGVFSLIKIGKKKWIYLPVEVLGPACASGTKGKFCDREVG